MIRLEIRICSQKMPFITELHKINLFWLVLWSPLLLQNYLAMFLEIRILIDSWIRTSLRVGDKHLFYIPCLKPQCK